MIKKFEDENCSITDKVKNLRWLVSTRLKFWQNWLIIVDNVVQLGKISSLLPQVGDPMWINGQIIVTIQNTDAAPQDDEFNKHISIRNGMNDRECFQLLKHYTIENADDQLLNEVSHALDRQPLALAAACYYVSRVNKANCSFTWKQYLEKFYSEEEENMDATFVKFNSVYPRNHVDVAGSLNNLGIVFYETRNYDKAIEVYEKALEIQKQSLGPNHVDVAASLNNLGLVFYKTGNYYKAIEVHEKALEIHQQLLGPNHIYVAASLNNLGNVFEKTGNYDKAIEFHKKALEIKKQSLGPNHVDVAGSLNSLGKVYIDTGNYHKAIGFHEKALEIQKQSLGPNHVDVAASLNNLGLVFKKTGN
ncbi:kinesin light chain 4-like [Xenia sp. Carnegie-2017]|uniref:kinesin light chain 4-like n=1 Tax=Xenia sp. Carnegie-2017 TaxID=2897299 RepID=UPI001F042B96|nr:kinesin light chain 4-like [Xenia sp. Carnegie-2017]